MAQPAGSGNDAIAVWERAIVARGGRDQLLRVENLLLSAHAESLHLGIHRSVRLFVFPNRFWLWHDHRPHPADYAAEMFNADEKICWQVRARIAPDSICPADLAYLSEPAQLAYLLESRWVQPRPLRTCRAVLEQGGGNVPLLWRTLHPELHRHQVDMVRAVWKGWTVDYYLDSRSHLPLRVRIALRPPPPEGELRLQVGDRDYRFSDYEAMDGIWMPTSQSTYAAWEDIQCRTNVTCDDELFRRQPRLEAGPDEWKTTGSPANGRRN